MNIDWSKIKSSKGFNVAMWIILPTAIVGSYYAYKYIRRRIDEKSKGNFGDLTKGMNAYYIRYPFNPANNTFSNFLEQVSKIDFHYIGNQIVKTKNNKDIVVLEFMMLPENEQKMLDLLKSIKPDAVLTRTEKSNFLTASSKITCEKETKDVEDTLTFDEFHQSIKCIEKTKMLGYDLKILKEIENLDKKVSLDELKKAYSLIEKGLDNLTNEDANEYKSIMNKALQ